MVVRVGQVSPFEVGTGYIGTAWGPGGMNRRLGGQIDDVFQKVGEDKPRHIQEARRVVDERILFGDGLGLLLQIVGFGQVRCGFDLPFVFKADAKNLHFALKIGLLLSSIKILHNVILFHTQLGILAQEVLGFCFVAQLDDQIYDDHLHIQ